MVLPVWDYFFNAKTSAVKRSRKGASRGKKKKKKKLSVTELRSGSRSWTEAGRGLVSHRRRGLGYRQKCLRSTRTQETP